MAEEAKRLASLIVVGGPLKDRRYDLEEVVAEVLIGSDPDCHLHVDLPGISPIHARLWTDLNRVTAYDTHAPRGIFVNDEQVKGEAVIQAGDWLWLGPPSEPDSVCIQCRFETWVEVLPEAAAAPEGAGVAEAPPPPASTGSPSPPMEAYEPGVLVDEPAPEEESVFVEAAPEAPPAAAPAPPPSPEAPPAAAPAPPPSPEAPPAAAPAPPPSPEVPPAAAPEPPPPAAAEPSPPAPAAPVTPTEPSPPPAEDPFFVGDDVTTAPPGPEPPAPAPVVDDAWIIEEPPTSEAPPAAPPAPPAEDHFFIAEEVLTQDAPATPAAVPPGATAPPPEPAPPAGSRPVESAPASAPPPPAAPTAPVPPTPPPEEVLEAVEVPLPSPTASGAPPATTPAAPVPPTAAAAPTPAAPTAPTPAAPAAPAPAPRRARPPGARRTPASAARRPARPRSRRGGSSVRFLALGAGAALVLGVAVIALVTWFSRTITLTDVSPARVRVGQRAVLTGTGFSDDLARNTVLFGDVTAAVISATGTRLEVEVPEAVAEAGTERRVPVVVRGGRLESEPFEVAVFQGPVLHGLSPDVALPGEVVVLAGAGWGIGATVRFGEVGAEILEIDPTQIRVTVPPLPGGYGTAAPAVVTVGGVESNPAPFFLGRLPLVTGLQPTAVGAGDVLTVSGRGFERDPGQNDVRVAGTRALVLSALGDELKVVVPRVPPGDPARPVEVRVPGSQEVGSAMVEVAAAPDPVPFRFVAEPFEGPSAHPHAVLSTALGPAFVLAAANGRPAAERAHEAQEALNAAAATLAASPGLLPEARDLDMRPVIGLPGQPQPLLEVTEADAAAYNEDWTRLRSRARAVTPARLARWWEAVARDLTLMLVRGEAPRFASTLASEGRVLQQVFDAAQRSGSPGVSMATVAGLRRGVQDGLSLIALRVPTSVTAEVAPSPGAAAAGPTPTPAPRVEPLRLDGTWTGTENEGGRRRYVTVTFRRDYGSIAYEGGLTLTVPFLKLDRRGRDRVRFTVQIRGGIRHYLGSWDGETLSGDIARDEAGRDVVGSFELRPR